MDTSMYNAVVFIEPWRLYNRPSDVGFNRHLIRSKGKIFSLQEGQRNNQSVMSVYYRSHEQP